MDRSQKERRGEAKTDEKKGEDKREGNWEIRNNRRREGRTERHCEERKRKNRK